jgi:hypothetical protein
MLKADFPTPQTLFLAVFGAVADPAWVTRSQLRVTVFLLGRESPALFPGTYFRWVPSRFGPESVEFQAMLANLIARDIIVAYRVGRSDVYRLSPL